MWAAAASDLFSFVCPGLDYNEENRRHCVKQLRSTLAQIDPDNQPQLQLGSTLPEPEVATLCASSGGGSLQSGAKSRVTAAAPVARGVCGIENTSASKPKQNGSRKGKAKPFDSAAYQVRYVALEVSYLGSSYHGFATQGDTDNTVEGHLFRALKRVRLVPQDATWQTVRYSRCGRTDKGVSALGQVVSLQLRSRAHATAPVPAHQEELEYPFLLNRVLPDTIRILGWADAPPDFHSRFGARWREYKYFLVQREGSLDLASMQAAANLFVGLHDFRNFCKMDVDQVLTFERKILDFRIEESPAGGIAGRRVYMLHVRGSAFLWHQVRCMAAVLLMVGRGEEKPDIVGKLLDLKATPSKPYYNMAAEEPLMLSGAAYEIPLTWHRSYRCVKDQQSRVAAMLDRHLITTTLVAALEQRLMSDATDDPTETELAAEAKCQLVHQPLLNRSTEPNYSDRVASLGRLPRAAVYQLEKRARLAALEVCEPQQHQDDCVPMLDSM